MWFALSGLIPVAFYLLLESDRKQFGAAYLLLFAACPVLIAGVCGFSLGSRILDRDEIRTSGQAMVCGLLVALLSYLLFFTTSALILSPRDDDPAGFLVGWAVVFIYGLIYVGWVIATVGVIGGWLLYLYRLKKFDHKQRV
jgi:Na+/proline symporter